MNIRTYAALFFLLFSFFSEEKIVAQCSPTGIEIPNNGIDEDCDGLDGHYLHLPKHIYMVEGNSFELFFRNIALSTHPSSYMYSVVSSLGGQNVGEKWVFTPSANQVGNHPFTVQIKHPFTGQTLATASTTVHIAAAQSPKAGQVFKTIIMGHSMVDQGILPNFIRKLGETPGNPAFSYFGTRTSWIDNSTKHQGKGGASWRFFAKDFESPYVFNGQLDIKRYLNENVCQGCAPELFVIELGGNDYLFQGLVNGSQISEIEAYIDNDMATNVLPFIRALRTAAPNTKIAICFEIPGNGRPNAFLNFFGPNSILNSHYRWRKIANTILFKYSQYFADREAENLHLIPIHMGVDDVNHFGDGDPVHPFPAGAQLNDPSGYQSMSKQIYAWMRHMTDGAPTGGGGGNLTQIDLALNMTGSVPNPAAYGNFSTTLQISNTSNVAATNVRVHVPKPAGVVLVADPATASAGHFRWYSDEIWEIPSIPAQSTASLSVKFYTLIGTAMPFYAQVVAADQSDVDSKPNNGNGTTANEDDETIFTTQSGSGGGGNTGNATKCDLELSLVGEANQVNAFANFTTTLTLQNKGQTAASDIQVRIPRPPASTYLGANAGTATAGSFVQWNDLWMLPSLAPNAAATLVIKYYTLSNDQMDFYAQVEMASPSDVDSSPNNGTAPTVHEDDEALFSLNAQGQTQCTISANGLAVRCENNNTSNNPSDDVFFFDLDVRGMAGTWTTRLQGSVITGLYGQVRSVGPFPIANGPVSLLVNDQANPNCSVNLTVSPPTTCSDSNIANCTNSADYPWHEWISRVTIGGNSKTSGKSSYSNFSSTTFPIQAGQTIPFSVQTKFSFFTFTEHLGIWIDLNKNGVYESNEKSFSAVSAPPAQGTDVQKTIAGFLQIPSNVAPGLTSMRVVLSRGTAALACGTFGFGEVEDYTISIAAALAPSDSEDLLRTGNGLVLTSLGDALLYPNPAHFSTRISLKKWQDKALDIQILDGFGRVVWTKIYDAVKTDFVECETKNFPAGIYSVYVRATGMRPEVLRLVVQE